MVYKLIAFAGLFGALASGQNVFPPSGAGGATSVGLSMPSSLCAVTNSPVTTTGTLTCSYATGQTANLILGSNSSGNVGLMNLTTAQLPFSLPLSVANGGTGTASPGLVAGTNVTSITGTWPNQTINAASSSTTLQTNGTNNGSQSTLNLASGLGMTVSDNGSGTVTIADRSVPLLSSFTAVNLAGGTAATATQTVSGGPIMLSMPFNAALNWKGEFVAQPSTPYKVIAQLRMTTFANTSSQNIGIYFYDGTKLMGLEFLNQTAGCQPRVEKITNVTTDGSTAVSFWSQGGVNEFCPLVSPMWVQLRNSGTTIFFDVSVDGTNFVNAFSEAVGTFITPTQIGFGGVNVGNNGNPEYLNLLNWRTVANATQ